MNATGIFRRAEIDAYAALDTAVQTRAPQEEIARLRAEWRLAALTFLVHIDGSARAKPEVLAAAINGEG